jgi:hypothetical protein
MNIFLSNYIVDRRVENGGLQTRLNNLLDYVRHPFDLQYVIDFSIPQEHAYQYISAETLFNDSQSAVANTDITSKMIIIAAGDYVGSYQNLPYSFPMPLALQYWCRASLRLRYSTGYDCPRTFSNAEAQAYMIHHFLNFYRILHIPDIWIMGIAAILAKAAQLGICSSRTWTTQRWLRLLAGGNLVYIVISLQAYITVRVLLPLAVPSLVFWCYMFLFYQKRLKNSS